MELVKRVKVIETSSAKDLEEKINAFLADYKAEDIVSIEHQAYLEMPERIASSWSALIVYTVPLHEVWPSGRLS